MVTKDELMTGEDLLTLPTGMGERYELVKGRLRVMAPAGGPHGKVASEILRQIANHVADHQLGDVFAAETGFYLRHNPDTVLAPDVAFLSKDRIPEDGLPEGYVPVIPDLVVELVSPDDRAGEVEKKITAWLEAGVQLVWVVYPDTRKVQVHTAPNQIVVYLEKDTLDGGKALPGFKAVVRSFFE
jgi:Uma2 family endonuclease